MDRLQKLQSKCLQDILEVNKFTGSTHFFREIRELLNCVKQIIIFRILIFIQKNN